LAGIALETGAGSLTLSGALALTDNASLNSSGGTITLVSGASAPSGTSISLPDTTLVLQNALSLTGVTLKTKNTTFTTNANALTLSGGILEVAGTQNLGGVLPDNSTTLRLAANSTIDDNASLSVGTLELANFALTLDDNMSRLSVAQPVTLDATGEKIVTGNADLSLNGGISVTAGTLSSTGGTLSLPIGATLSGGASFSTSNTTLNLGGSLVVADTWTSTNTSILLTDNASLSSTEEMSLATLDTNGYGLMLESATSDLTITEGVTIRYPAGGGPTINSGEADLTLDGSVSVPYGGILSSGGTVTFGAGSSGASFTENSGMILENTTLVLQTALDLPYLQLSGTSSFQTNGNTLNLGFLEIGVQNQLDLTNVVTNSESELLLIANSAITKTGALVFKQIVTRGYTLTLNSAITSLTAENIYIPNLHDPNEPNYLASTGRLLAQGVDVTLSRQIDLRNGTIEMGGGTLTLEQGGYIQEEGVLDLSNSVLEISGQFKNDGGTLTTSGSTLRLKGNTYLGNGGPVTFATFEPNGWGLKLTDNTTHLTLAGDVLLQPNDESWNNMTDKALDFDGSNDYVDVGDFSLGGSLTFEAWMKYDSRATWSRIFDFSENGGGDVRPRE